MPGSLSQPGVRISFVTGSITMRQIVLNQPGEFLSRDTVVPQPGENQAIVRVHRIGVCGTDLHAFAGRQPYFEYPRVLGHELGVEIVEIPENQQGLAAGDHCALEPYLSCGSCTACRQGKTNCCTDLKVLGVHTDGGMQPYITAPVHLLHKSTTLSLDQLALVETLGIGFHAVERAAFQNQDSVLVIGAGPIGLSVIQFARAAGAHVRVLDVSPQRRQFVADLGIEVLSEPDDNLADVVFDATGNKLSMEASLERVAPGGRLVFVGLILDKVAIDDPLFHRREITLLASRNSANAFPRIIQMIEEGSIDTAPWITHRLELAAVPDEFPGLPQQEGLIKAVIEVDSEDGSTG
jgi:2-desacetyl-2-hydroxyethyl bacteriochlorophyllide A dehydrogenase